MKVLIMSLTMLVCICLMPGALAYLISRHRSLSIVIVMLNLLYVWFALPHIAINNYGSVWWIFVNGALIFCISYFVKDEERKENTYMTGIGVMFLSLACGVVIIPLMLTNPFLNASEYRKLIGEVKSSRTPSAISLMGFFKITPEDAQRARTVAREKLRTEPRFRSFDVGSMEVQVVKDRLYWVGPLVYASFVGRLFAGKGTPGYVMVSVINENNVTIVDQINGQPLMLKFDEGAFLFRNLRRYVYVHGYATTGLTNWHFEIDDEGYPYYVATIYKRKVLFTGKDAAGVLLIDPQTGVIESKSIKDVPKWIDDVQPADIVHEQIEDWNKYVHGFLNSMRAKKDIMRVSEGAVLVYADDGQSYWRVGIYPSRATVENEEFIFVHRKTKEVIRCIQPGETVNIVMGTEGEDTQKVYTSIDPMMALRAAAMVDKTVSDGGQKNSIYGFSERNVVGKEDEIYERSLKTIERMTGEKPVQLTESRPQAVQRNEGKKSSQATSYKEKDHGIMTEAEYANGKNDVMRSSSPSTDRTAQEVKNEPLPQTAVVKNVTPKTGDGMRDDVKYTGRQKEETKKNVQSAMRAVDHNDAQMVKTLPKKSDGNVVYASAARSGLENFKDYLFSKHVEGVVLRFGQEAKDSTIICYFLIDTMKSKVFSVDVRLSDEAFETRPGDMVVISYENNDKDIIPASAFDNKSMDERKEKGFFR